MLLAQVKYTLGTIDQAAKAIWAVGKDYSVWSLVGDMGAGKTTLVSAICKQLGVADAVSSPTYAIAHEYELIEESARKRIFHCDWYRLHDSEEARQAGMEDMLYQPNTYTIVEWASQAPELLYLPYLCLSIEVLSETERQASLSVG
ncbi:MAG: tRNA (adenosine(37)-N6)-threonylcarbamoyltransferase complex ATPase subunit type 1 TsaE [Chitinophagaceae bacterium]|nr:tRNA (adenosine(37)-N6)-threonylcarbamoyltransferase complex ATPase subunit type 1 TsaE [Chitinophagaceae bacterium]